MKRLFTLLLALALLCALTVPALADAAYLPENNFLTRHMDECSYVSRSYWTNGPSGYVLARKTPDSAEATPLPNGGIYYVSYLYKDRWGFVEFDKDTLQSKVYGSGSGWVDMAEMTPDYDNRAFMADHADELVSEIADLAWDEPQNVFTYKYPGSGVVLEELERNWFGGETIVFNTLFTDPAGRRWGYCHYLYAHRDFWVCLDDPYNGALPPDENCVTIVTQAAAEPAPTEAPKPTEAPAATPEPSGAPAPTEAPVETDAPAETEAPAPAPVETPAPTEKPGRTVELTPPADDATLQQAAKDNRGSGPYIAAGCAAVAVIAAAVLFAALRKKKKQEK